MNGMAELLRIQYKFNNYPLTKCPFIDYSHVYNNKGNEEEEYALPLNRESDYR